MQALLESVGDVLKLHSSYLQNTSAFYGQSHSKLSAPENCPAWQSCAPMNSSGGKQAEGIMVWEERGFGVQRVSEGPEEAPWGCLPGCFSPTGPPQTQQGLLRPMGPPRGLLRASSEQQPYRCAQDNQRTGQAEKMGCRQCLYQISNSCWSAITYFVCAGN